jgi:catechol 2,3-dioxygenase-like lactoylglutathione lyase family enzyme
MSEIAARFVGVELYFDDLERAKKFYVETLGMHVSADEILKFAQHTIDKRRNGEPMRGAPKLASTLGEDVLAKFRGCPPMKWLPYAEGSERKPFDRMRASGLSAIWHYAGTPGKSTSAAGAPSTSRCVHWQPFRDPRRDLPASPSDSSLQIVY